MQLLTLSRLTGRHSNIERLQQYKAACSVKRQQKSFDKTNGMEMTFVISIHDCVPSHNS